MDHLKSVQWSVDLKRFLLYLQYVLLLFRMAPLLVSIEGNLQDLHLHGITIRRLVPYPDSLLSHHIMTVSQSTTHCPHPIQTPNEVATSSNCGHLLVWLGRGSNPWCCIVSECNVDLPLSKAGSACRRAIGNHWDDGSSSCNNNKTQQQNSYFTIPQISYNKTNPGTNVPDPGTNVRNEQ